MSDDAGAWTDGEDGPDCACGEPTFVKRGPGGKWLLVCFFHAGDAGLYRELPARKPEGWGAAA